MRCQVTPDLAAERPTVTISGTVVALAGQSVQRQAHTKSSAGFRTVTLPRFAVETLLRRQVAATPNPHNLVFPSSTGTIRTPNNVRRLRKTVATIIDREMTTADAASQLGHAKASMTAKHYIEHAAIAPDTSHVLEAFGSKTVGKRGGSSQPIGSE